MTNNFEITLIANSKPIELSGFPKEFLTKTLAGAVSSLKRVDEVKTLELALDSGKLKLAVNGNQVPLGPFPNLFMVNMLTGIVATLKGVDDKVTSLEIRMQSI